MRKAQTEDRKPAALSVASHRDNLRADPAEQDGEDEDDYGPPLPESYAGIIRNTGHARHAPGIPTLDDIRSRTEDARLLADEEREQRRNDLEHACKLDRKQHKERLEEIAPRAEPGTRERQLEKRREVADSNRSFAAGKDGGDADIPDNDVMGGDDLNELKKRRKEEQRRKTDREIKRDEIERAKAMEREERSKRVREKEEKTMNMLKELARSRYGDGNVQPATLRES